MLDLIVQDLKEQYNKSKTFASYIKAG